MPKRLVYWCSIRLGCNATQDSYSIAKTVAIENLPNEPKFIVSLVNVMLHGSMIDKT